MIKKRLRKLYPPPSEGKSWGVPMITSRNGQWLNKISVCKQARKDNLVTKNILSVFSEPTNHCYSLFIENPGTKREESVRL